MSTEIYDVIIAGGGLGACLAACEAAGRRRRVLLISPETFLGAEITATLSPWMPETDSPSPLAALFGELSRLTDGEQAFCLGSLKKNLLAMLHEAGVSVLFASRIAGVIQQDARTVGVVIGNKSGLQGILGRAVIDATEQQSVLLMAGGSVAARGRTEASFAAEYAGVLLPMEPVPGNDAVEFHAIPGTEGLVAVRHRLAVDLSRDGYAARNQAELEARERVIAAGRQLIGSHPAFAHAMLGRLALRMSLPPPAVSNVPDGILAFPPSCWPFDLDAVAETAREVGASASAASPVDTIAPRQIGFGSCRIPWEGLNPRAASSRNYLRLHYFQLDMPAADQLPLLAETEVLVAGGGTAGAPAGIAAAMEGARVIVTESSAALGGTGCAGGINCYYHGCRDAMTARIDSQVQALSAAISPGNPPDPNRWNISVKELALLTMLRAHGGQAMFHCQALHPICRGNQAIGALVLTDEGLATVRAEVIIDATGDGDLAVRAGASVTMADPRGGNVQTFNQCRWVWQPNRNGYNNDLGVIDNRDFIDTTRGVVSAHWHADPFDFSPMPVVRESRHVHGDATFSLRDVFLPQTCKDTISRIKTDFDQHGLQGSLFARLGYLPYHTVDYTARVPYRIALPRNVEGMLVTAKAVSATQDGFSFLRMQPDLQNLGAATGVAAALSIAGKRPPRSIDTRALQERLLALGTIQADDMAEDDACLHDEAGAIARLSIGDESALPEVLLGDGSQLPRLQQHYARAEGEARRLLAMALAWFGDPRGCHLLIAALNELRIQPQSSDWDHHQRPTGGFTGTPSTYWRVNQLIVLLGIAGDLAALPLLIEIASETDAGGETNENPRLHWRRVPNYDRIVCLCLALERFAAPAAVPALERLLNRPGIRGHLNTDRADADRAYPSAYLEVAVARTLARCGGKAGAIVLAAYLDDVRMVLSAHARDELQAIAGSDIGDDPFAWRDWLASHDITPLPYRQLERF